MNECQISPYSCFNLTFALVVSWWTFGELQFEIQTILKSTKYKVVLVCFRDISYIKKFQDDKNQRKIR